MWENSRKNSADTSCSKVFEVIFLTDVRRLFLRSTQSFYRWGLALGCGWWGMWEVTSAFGQTLLQLITMSDKQQRDQLSLTMHSSDRRWKVTFCSSRKKGQRVPNMTSLSQSHDPLTVRHPFVTTFFSCSQDKDIRTHMRGRQYVYEYIDCAISCNKIAKKQMQYACFDQCLRNYEF